MDFDGGSPYFRDSGIKKEDGQGLFDAEPCLIIGNHDGGYYANFVDNDVNNHNRSVLSISERGDNNTKCRLSVAVPPLCLTTCAGISPSALLESPVMIPTDQGKTNNELCTNNQTTDINNEVGRERIANPNPEKRHKGSSGLAKNAEDGYSWRKYGQKDVKRSQLPRSYYRCRTMNCPAKKFVERSLEDGSIIQIIYKGGKHNHSAEPGKHGTCVKAEVEGSPSSNQDLGDDDPMCEQLESNLDLSPSLAADEEDEGGGGPSDSRKRKRDIFPSEDALERSSRDPRVIVQVKSETTILDDGYRWRKYGQKVVKGNHNPRSYYKCTTQGCPVRKQVERASNDATSVITTYDGKHTHEVPSTKSNNNGNLTIASTNNTAASPKRDFARSPSQILPSYNPPLFSYNEFMNANLPLNIPPPATNRGNLNLLPFSSSPSSSYQFPQFHSLPYASLSNISGNSHVRRTYQSSSSSSPYSSYPMIPDFMSLPAQINQRVPNVLLPNFGFSNNNYAPLSVSGRNHLQAQQPAVQLKNNEVVRSTDGV